MKELKEYIEQNLDKLKESNDERRKMLRMVSDMRESSVFSLKDKEDLGYRLAEPLTRNIELGDARIGQLEDVLKKIKQIENRKEK